MRFCDLNANGFRQGAKSESPLRSSPICVLFQLPSSRARAGFRLRGLARCNVPVARLLGFSPIEPSNEPIQRHSQRSRRPLAGPPTTLRTRPSHDRGLPERQTQGAERHLQLDQRPFAVRRDTIATTPRHVRRLPGHDYDYPQTRSQTSETRLRLSPDTLAATRDTLAATRDALADTRDALADTRDAHAATRGTLADTRILCAPCPGRVVRRCNLLGRPRVRWFATR